MDMGQNCLKPSPISHYQGTRACSSLVRLQRCGGSKAEALAMKAVDIARGLFSGGHMQRRDFITLLGGAAVAWPLVARAQQQALSVVGFLHSGPASSNAHLVDAFRRGLAEAGYVDGRNVTIEYRWAEGHYERLAGLAAELVRRPAAVIVGGAPPAARAAKAATTTIPVVFVSGDDPITSGLVEKINRPGGNITGISVFSGSQLGAKHVQLLHELLPTAAAIALLVNPTNATQTEAQTQQTEDAAHRVGLRLHVMNASTASDFGKAFAMLAEQRVVYLYPAANSVT
jgi:putative ABC transport system substrate-binding protein